MEACHYCGLPAVYAGYAWMRSAGFVSSRYMSARLSEGPVRVLSSVLAFSAASASACRAT